MDNDAYYLILGVPKNMPTTMVTKQYRRLALEYHPDKNHHNPEEAERRFKDIVEAYEVLKDPENKRFTTAWAKRACSQRKRRSSHERKATQTTTTTAG